MNPLTLKEKIAFLYGMIEGRRPELLKEGTVGGAKTTLLEMMVDVLSDVVNEIEDLKAAYNDLENYVETLDEDLTELEEEVYEDAADVAIDVVEAEGSATTA